MLGAGLSAEQLRLLQRFRPELSWEQTDATAPLARRADRDTIGFFIAKFLKNWPEGLVSSTPSPTWDYETGNVAFTLRHRALWRAGVDKNLTPVYSVCLLTAALRNCRPYRDKLYKDRGAGGDEWVQQFWGRHNNSDDTAAMVTVDSQDLGVEGSGSTVVCRKRS